MTAPDRIYRGVTVGGRVVYQDTLPSADQLVWPWEAYIRADQAAPQSWDDVNGTKHVQFPRPTTLAEALAVPEVKALVEAAKKLRDEYACFKFNKMGNYYDPGQEPEIIAFDAAFRAIGEGRG